MEAAHVASGAQKVLRRRGQLMQGKTDNDRVRPCAYPILGGKQWVVHLVQYPGRSDPLMEGRVSAKPSP
jgi:hypothetical protein